MMDALIQNLKNTPGHLFKPEKLGLSRKLTNVLSETKRSLPSRVELDNQDRFLQNISLAKARLKATDSALTQLNHLILKVKRITIRMTDKTCNYKAWKQAAGEVEEIFIKILETANDQDMESHVFSGKQPTTSLFRKVERRLLHPGDTETVEPEIESGSNLNINSIHSNFLTKPLKTLGEDFDLNPGIDQNTRLSDLNRGRGVNLGSMRIADDNADVFWDINLHSATTVGDVINTINSCEIAGLSADINAFHKGLKLIHTGSGKDLTLSETKGTTGRDLGILTNLLVPSASQPSSLEGQNLNPILTEDTPISLLKSGGGLNLGTIKIAQETTQRIVDLSSASTVGEIIDAICNSIPGVVASVNSLEKGISVESTVVGKSLVVSDGDDKKSARGLGISGSPDMLGSLSFLMEALYNQDGEVISEGLETLNSGLEEISCHKAKTEAKLKILENIEARLRDLRTGTSKLLSEVNSADVSRVTTDLANQQSVFKSALKRGSALVQPTLLDFIR